MEQSLGGLQTASNGIIVSYLYQGLLSSVAMKIQLLYIFCLKNLKKFYLKSDGAVTGWPPDGLHWPYSFSFIPRLVVLCGREDPTTFVEKF